MDKKTVDNARKFDVIEIVADDDLNVIVEKIKEAQQDIVALRFPEDNDVINSPIGLKTLQRKSVDFEKALIVISPAEQYDTLIKDANIAFVESTSDINESLIEKLQNQLKDLKLESVGLNSKKQSKKISHTTDEKTEEDNKIASTEPEAFEPPPIFSGGKQVDAELDELNVIDELEETELQEEKRPLQVKTGASGMTGVDFSKIKTKSNENVLSRVFRGKPSPSSAEERLPPVTKYQADQEKPAPKGMFLRFLLIIILGIGLFSAAIFAVYYYYFPKVRIELRISSESISISDEIVGRTTVTGFDTVKKEIPLIKETSEKTGSSNVSPTGTGVAGEKAKGTVNLIKMSGEDVSLPVGTALQTSNGLTFVTEAAVTVSTPVTVAVVASQLGDEYNVAASGEYNWSVAGHTNIKGQNFSSFTGGTKRSYKVVSKEDYDKAVEELKKELFSQIQSDLEFKNRDNGYSYLNQSLKSEIKDSPTINPVVGAETDVDAFLEMKTTGTALYYQTDSLQRVVEQLIKTKYESSLTEKNNTLSVSNQKIDIKDIKIGTDDVVTFVLEASGLVTLQVDTEQIKSSIAGKKWEEMGDSVKRLNSLASDPNIQFFPSWFPKELWYVPNETSRIDISVQIVE